MKKDKNRKLHGSVLLTVVFVMSILIIFLFGTLTLALAANNRAHVNYSSAQTGITARAVAESAIKAISNGSQAGKDYAAAVDALTPGSDPITVNAQLSGTGIGSLGDIEPVVITYAGTKQYYDPEKCEWQNRDLLRFTATVNMAGVQKQSSVYVLKLDKTDAVESSGGGAGFVTTADALFETQTSLFGGAYINLPHPDVADKYKEHYLKNYNERVENRTFRNNFGSGDNVVPLNLQNSKAVIEADVVVNNDMTIENWSGFVFPGEGKGITIWGDMYFNNVNSGTHLRYVANNISSNIAFNKIPYIYVDGRIYGKDGHVKIGEKDQDFPLNTFCGSIQVGKNANARDHAVLSTNLYCMDKDADSYIVDLNNNPGLYSWTGNVLSKVKEDSPITVVNGEICTKGNLELGKVTINGDLRVEGNLTITDEVTVKGKVVCGKKITGADKLNCDNVYNNELAANGAGAEIKEVEFDNLVGYYYVHTPTQSSADATVYVGPHGFPLNDKYFDENGKLKPEHEGFVTPSDLRLYYTLEYGWKQSDIESINHIDSVTPMYEDDPELHKYFAKEEDLYQPSEGNSGENPAIKNEGFYINTYVEELKPGDSNTEGYVEVGAEGKTFMLIPDGYEKTEHETFKADVVINGGNAGNKYKTIEEFKNDNQKQPIYPKYAERKTVLGLDDTLNKSETKVVLTLDEVLKDIANPYNAVTLPADVQQKYNALKSDSIITSQAQINEKFCNVIAYTKTSNVSATSKYSLYKNNTWTPYYEHKLSEYTNYKELTETDFEGKTESEKQEMINENEALKEQEKQKEEWTKVYSADNAATYIAGNCILDGVTFSNGKGDVIIDPQGTSIVIGIRGTVTFDSSVQILSADGGKVFFYLEPGATLLFNGNNMCTATYWKHFASTKNFSYKSTPTEPNTVEIDKLNPSCPNIYVYGADDSNLTIENMSVMTMNVISPGIEAHIKGSGGELIDSLLYNGYETKGDSKQYVIGCFNVNNAKSQNPFNVVYIPEGNNAPQVIGSADNTYKCKILYYSEF